MTPSFAPTVSLLEQRDMVASVPVLWAYRETRALLGKALLGR